MNIYGILQTTSKYKHTDYKLRRLNDSVFVWTEYHLWGSERLPGLYYSLSDRPSHRYDNLFCNYLTFFDEDLNEKRRIK